MRSRILAWAVLAAFAVEASAQSAPRAPSDSLPRELVEALLRPYLGIYPNGGSAFVVGRVPPSLAPYFFVPSGARVLGGIESGSTTVVVLSVPMSVDDLRAAYRREQLRLGWTPPPPAGSRGWGFVPAPGNGTDGGSLIFCHIGQSLQIVPYQAPSQPILVTATVQSYGFSCGSQTRFMTSNSTAVELPLMWNPQDAVMNDRTCLGTNNLAGGNGTSERLQTKLSPAQLIDHFSKQLSDSGWSASPAVAAIRGVWTRPDSGGAARELTLTITPSTVAGCQELAVQVRRIPGR